MGASGESRAVGLDPLPGVSNYVVGEDPECWRTGGAAVSSGDVEADGFDEIVSAPGPGAGTSHRPKAVGFDWDGALLARVPGLDVTATFLTSYGGGVALGDLTGEGGDDLLLGQGADPKADARVRPWVYAGGRAVGLLSFDPFPGAAYGVAVAGGRLGW